MKLFDTHFHYYGETLPEEYILKAGNRGVKYLLAAGTDYSSSVTAQRFAESTDLWFSAGVHPHESSDYTQSISMFDIFKGNNKLVAVGEIGLDYFYENSDRNSQRKVFRNFLNLASKWQKPVIIHCRDRDSSDVAYSDTFNILSEYISEIPSFVVHCYTGTITWAENFLDLGAYLGITGIVTFPKASNVREILSIIPDDKLLLETDTPYLAPVPHRGKTNHSEYLRDIAEFISKGKNTTLEQLAEITTRNAFKFFNITQHG